MPHRFLESIKSKRKSPDYKALVSKFFNAEYESQDSQSILTDDRLHNSVNIEQILVQPLQADLPPNDFLEQSTHRQTDKKFDSLDDTLIIGTISYYSDGLNNNHSLIPVLSAQKRQLSQILHYYVRTQILKQQESYAWSFDGYS